MDGTGGCDIALTKRKKGCLNKFFVCFRPFATAPDCSNDGAQPIRFVRMGVGLTQVLQGGDTFFQRRVAHEQPAHAAGIDAEGSEFAR